MKTFTRSNIRTCLLLAIAAMSAYSGLSLAQETTATLPSERMTYRNNEVHLLVLSPGYTLMGGTYDTFARSITSGQDPQDKNKPPQTYDISGHDGTLSFSVGRKGSEQVADWFSHRLATYNNTFGKNPDKLNFAFAGNLALAIQGPGLNPDTPVRFPDIVFAQGRKVLANNWWFGGLYCTRVLGVLDKLVCPSNTHPSMTFTFVRGFIEERPDAGVILSNASNEVYVYISQR